ncbi:MAG: hypothetical protein QXT43_02195 [Candidatus Micrarchaeaceae archaeon]
MRSVRLRGTLMGDAAVLFRVYTEEGKTEEVKEEITSTMKPKSIAIEDVAFGIKVLKVLFVHDDKEGSSGYEDKLKRIKGVSEVEVLEETLIS